MRLIVLSLMMAALCLGDATARDNAHSRGGAKSMSAHANARDKALEPVIEARLRDWRVGPVVYQVFVDRFAPSDNLEAKKALYVAPRTLRDWDRDLPRQGKPVPETGVWSHELEFWGGDLASVRGKVGYLADLGVDVLYLNPIHHAMTNHKYDAWDFHAVSPEYGTRADVRALAQTLEQRSMRLVLDGVFNHMGRKSPRFQAALADPNSPERAWFTFDPRFRDGYAAWAEAGNLPELNWENPAVRDHIYARPDSVAQSYLREGVDGWRLDVAYDLGFVHLADFTSTVHRVRPDAVVIGEVWNYPSDWVGASMDGIMNLTLAAMLYGMTEGRVPARQAADAFERMVEDTSYEGLLRSWIVLDNHDRPRLATVFPDAQRRRFVQALQFTLPGSPNVYYGVEVGMTGGEDPGSRGPMRWDLVREDNPDFAWMKTLMTLRREAPALRVGEFRRLDAERLFAFARYTHRVADTVIVLANPSEQPVEDFFLVRDAKLMNGELWRDALSGAEARVHSGAMSVRVPAKTVFVLRPVMTIPGRDYSPYKRVQ